MILFETSPRVFEIARWGEVFHGRGRQMAGRERATEEEWPRLSRQTRLLRDSMDPTVFSTP